MKYFSSCEEVLVFNWTLVSITLFSFTRWTNMVTLQWKLTFFPAYVDTFLPIHNHDGIPGLQIPQSWIPMWGLQSSCRENYEIAEAAISVILAVCRDFTKCCDLPWFCWFHQIVQYLLGINCNLCCDFSSKLILSTNSIAFCAATDILVF